MDDEMTAPEFPTDSLVGPCTAPRYERYNNLIFKPLILSARLTRPKSGQTCRLNPLYMTRISWRVNLVSRQRSSSATGIGFGARAGSSSYTTSSIGLSGGVAIFSLTLNEVTAAAKVPVPLPLY
uniref:Uncharacterized protein n=1 Tax=Anopheles coluzzii TaxID=1518534 RepID=A0A8W7P1W9_ANOCL